MTDSTPTLWQQPLDEEGPVNSGNGGTEARRDEASWSAAACGHGRALAQAMMERICDPSNLNEAYIRVVRNKGSAGVDGMSVGELRSWIREHKEALIGSLLDGSHQPQPVRGVQIPKAGDRRKGMRQLGIPTVYS